MKNILVFGWSRAGKTTLTKKLREEFKYNMVCTSCLFTALDKSYPQLELSHPYTADGYDNYLKSRVARAPFIANYFSIMACHPKFQDGNKFVADVEFDIVDFDEVLPLMDKGEFIFIGLVNNATSKELYNNLKKYDTQDDWTYNHPDEDLKRFCEDYPKLNQAYNEIFKRYNFLIYDTSGNREEVFAQIIKDVSVETQPV